MKSSEFNRSRVKFWHKVSLAFVVVVFGPAVVDWVMNRRIEAISFDFCFLSIVFIAPLLVVALVLRHLGLRKSAIGFFSAGILIYLTIAILSLFSELHGPLLGYIYLPVLAASAPLGLYAILDSRDIRNANSAVLAAGERLSFSRKVWRLFSGSLILLYALQLWRARYLPGDVAGTRLSFGPWVYLELLLNMIVVGIPVLLLFLRWRLAIVTGLLTACYFVILDLY